MSDPERTPEELRWQHIQEGFDELRALLSEDGGAGYSFLLVVHHLQSGTAISSMSGNALQIAGFIDWLAGQAGGDFKRNLVLILADHVRKEREEARFDIAKDGTVTH